MKRIVPVIACAALAVASAVFAADPMTQRQKKADDRAAEKAKRPPVRFESGDIPSYLPVSPFDRPTLLVTLASPNDGDALAMFFAALRRVRGIQNNTAFMLRPQGNRDGNVILLEVLVVANEAGKLDLKGHDLVEALARDLALDTALSAEAREAAIRATQAEFKQAMLNTGTIRQIIAGSAPPSSEPIKERVQTLQADRRTIESSMTTLNARYAALTRTQERLTTQRQSAQEQDPVVIELKKIVELRRQKVEKIESMLGAKAASQTVLTEEKLAETEARLRLAERRAAVVAPGVMASLEQINVELTKLSVDMEELQERRRQVDAQLAPFDLSRATTQSVAEAAKVVEAGQATSAAPKLSKEINDHADRLAKELLRLQILKIEPTDE